VHRKTLMANISACIFHIAAKISPLGPGSDRLDKPARHANMARRLILDKMSNRQIC
jgi:hypothetical protein